MAAQLPESQNSFYNRVIERPYSRDWELGESGIPKSITVSMLRRMFTAQRQYDKRLMCFLKFEINSDDDESETLPRRTQNLCQPIEAAAVDSL